MMRYDVIITDDAFADMVNIYNYISHELQSPDNARKQYERIAKAVLSLDELPERYPYFNAEPEHSLGTCNI